MKRTTGQDRSITRNWRPATQAVRAGTWRSEQGETSEAIFATSGYSYDDASTPAARFAGELDGMTYSRLQNPTVQMLDQEPHRRAILSDITCDSDGKVDRFILADGVSPSLPVHELPADRDYYMGVFFVGAYQETLGDLHNLFGDTNVVTIDLREDGGFDLLHEQEGDTIAEVLSYVLTA